MALHDMTRIYQLIRRHLDATGLDVSDVLPQSHDITFVVYLRQERRGSDVAVTTGYKQSCMLRATLQATCNTAGCEQTCRLLSA